MSMSCEVVMPQFGQAMEFGKLVEWLVPDGRPVTAGQPIALVESDKASYEIEAPATGLLQHVAAAGDEIAVGERIGQIGAGVDAPVSGFPIAPLAPHLSASPDLLPAPAGEGRILASPKARELARGEGFDLADVRTVRPDGIIVAADVERHRASARPAGTRPLSPLRKAAARRLARSWAEAPHFVQMIEVDATALMEARGWIRAGLLSCSLNDILIRSAGRTLADFPDINASYEDEALQPLPDVSVGLAVASDAGLTVPVVRNAAARSLEEIAAETGRLIDAGRRGTLKPDELGRASLTISNLGHYGVAFGTPVLNLGEPILLFVGTIEDRAVGLNGQIVLRPRTTLSICYDHRVVDGLRAAQFSQALKARLETLEGILPATLKPGAREEQVAIHLSGQGMTLRIGGAQLSLEPKDADILAVAAALAALSRDLSPRPDDGAFTLDGVEVRMSSDRDAPGARLICDSPEQLSWLRQAIEAAPLASGTKVLLQPEIRQ